MWFSITHRQYFLCVKKQKSALRRQYILPFLSCYNICYVVPQLVGKMPSLRPLFWKKYPLAALNADEWEALCDGCGQCCLIKLEDDETDEVAYTKVACQLLDCSTGYCSDYVHRKNFVPDCIQLTLQKITEIAYWLPTSCAYRRLYEGKNLPSWHYLNTGSRKSVIQAKKSVAGRCISEKEINDDDIDEYIVRWVR